MSTLLISWPLKRSIIARLQGHADGSIPVPAGAEFLATGDPAYDGSVQVEYALPAEPDRLCVFGGPIRMTRTERTAEVARQGGGIVDESPIIELRVRVYSPGEDVAETDRTLGNLLQAVAVAVLDGQPFMQHGAITLQSVTQDPIAIAPNPEPSVVAYAAMVFAAEVLTS